VILRDVTADSQLADQTVLQNAENGDVGTKKIKIINNPFNLGTGTLEADLEAGTEYELVLRLEATANGLFGLSDFLSGDRQATFTCVTTAFDDTDGDGLSDQWEQSGIDVDGDGNIDLNLQALGADYNGTPMKADPNHKDIFVEVDYFDCTVAGGDCIAGDTHVHQPMAATLDLIRQSFANAPVTNPDGQTGINLWVQVDEALPHQAACDLDPPCYGGGSPLLVEDARQSIRRRRPSLRRNQASDRCRPAGIPLPRDRKAHPGVCKRCQVDRGERGPARHPLYPRRKGQPRPAGVSRTSGAEEGRLV
jgi:hypothetical protein